MNQTSLFEFESNQNVKSYNNNISCKNVSLEDEHIDDESFQGDCNDGEEFGNQVDLFEVHFGISSGNSGKFEDLNESDLLPEDFFKTSYHKVSVF